MRSIAQQAMTSGEARAPLPARANTSGTVSAGEVVGAIAEMDCERVSAAERTLWRRPESRGEASSGVRTSRGRSGLRCVPADWDGGWF